MSSAFLRFLSLPRLSQRGFFVATAPFGRNATFRESLANVGCARANVCDRFLFGIKTCSPTPIP